VSATSPFGGGVFIADTSAWSRADRFSQALRGEWKQALVNDQIAACSPIVLEILYSARTPSEYDEWANRLGAMRRLATMNADAHWVLVEGYREIAHQGDHRSIPFPDLMAAAAATAHHWGVLRYDGHFDRLAHLQAFSFDSRWIAPSGSLD
jgi:predicted nucleic acid-binding protein